MKVMFFIPDFGMKTKSHHGDDQLMVVVNKPKL